MATFLGKPVTLVGQQLQIEETVPDFTLTTTDLTQKSLSGFVGKKKAISVTPSIDTGICSTQTRISNKELSDVGDTVAITIPADLPFVQACWCGAEGLKRAVMMSDYYDNTLGETYGFLTKEWHLLAHVVLILDEDNKLVYTEYLESVSSKPNYRVVIGVVEVS